MEDHTYLRKEIEGRLSAAFGLLSAAAPEAAYRIEQAFRRLLQHNKLELALDELVAVTDTLQASLPRRFHEERLVAAMLMRLPKQLSHIAAEIVDLEAHVFGSSLPSPHLRCDFNGFIASDVYGLDAVSTALDAARLHLVLTPGLRVVLYDADSDANNAPTWLLADAELSEFTGYGIVAKVDPGSYRSIQRRD